MNELLTNSLRHAFRDNRKRHIWFDFTLDLRTDSYVIVCRDNGIGLPEDFDLKKVATLGLQLIEGLTRQLNGTITYRNNGGAQFTIIFPRSKKEAISHG
ncbi:MAG: sensor histidine kinase [Candidatus Omnitrophica bacterium]|nr:sensor histidine kinase [Candidatus Omnitrophota bacterium]